MHRFLIDCTLILLLLGRLYDFMRMYDICSGDNCSGDVNVKRNPNPNPNPKPNLNPYPTPNQKPNHYPHTNSLLSEISSPEQLSPEQMSDHPLWTPNYPINKKVFNLKGKVFNYLTTKFWALNTFRTFLTNFNSIQWKVNCFIFLHCFLLLDQH